MRLVRPSVSAILAAGLPMLMAGPALAQAPSSAAPVQGEGAQADEGAALSEIVVVARKRAENQQDTPISIVSLRGEDLAQRGVENLRDLQRLAPSLQITATQAGSSANAQVYIRGVGQSDYKITSDQAVGLYVDGVYMARSMGAAMDVIDVAQVDVLRGPQGTLFGRNTLAGAIQYTTVQPSYAFEGYVEGAVGSRDRADVKAVLNLPLIDNMLAARLTVSRLRQDGYGERLYQDVDTGDTENDAARLQILFEPAPNLAFTLAGDYSQRRGNSSVETLVSVLDPSALATYNADLEAQGLRPVTDENFVTGDAYESWAGAPNGDEYDNAGLALTAAWEINPEFTFKSITSFRTLETHSNYDFAAVPYPLSWQDITIDQEQLSQELQLSFKSADNRVTGVAGLYYFSELAEERDLDPYFELPTATGECDLCFTVSDTFTNLYDIYMKQRTISVAAFAQGGYAFTPRLTATVGLRYTKDEKRFLNALYYNNSYQFYTFNRPINEVSNEWTDVSPHVSLQYKATEDALLYASFSKGYKAGGYNAISFDAVAPESYDPEEIYAYEVGAKTEWLQRRLRVNASAFVYDYRGVVGNALVDAAYVVENIGEFYVYGGEVEIDALLGDDLKVSLGVGYLGQELRSVTEGGDFTIREDSRLPNMPEFSGNLSLDYGRAVGDLGRFDANATLTYKGEHEFLLPNREGEGEDGYALLNAALSLTPNIRGKTPLAVTLFGRNLTDETYKIYAENSVDFGLGLLYAQYGKPREWGLSARYRY